MEENKLKRLGSAWITLLLLVVIAILTFIFVPLIIALGIFVFLYLPIMIYILIYKWIGKWFAALVFAFSLWLNILILTIPVFGGLMFLDLTNFSEDFATQPKYIALEDSDIIFATAISSLDQTSEQPFLVLTKTELTQLQNEIETKSVNDKIVFVMKRELFRVVDEIHNQDIGITLTTDEAFQLLKSEEPLSFIADKLSANITQGIPEESLIVALQNNPDFNPDTVKSFTALLLVQEALEKGGSDYIVSELKEGNIKIYPERLSLKILIKIVPEGLLKQIIPSLPGESSTNAFGAVKEVQSNISPGDSLLSAKRA